MAVIVASTMPTPPGKKPTLPISKRQAIAGEQHARADGVPGGHEDEEEGQHVEADVQRGSPAPGRASRRCAG